ncbi:hypothetical protein N0V90_008701 [Kalmusia sp. IMI 367209]|nr:hypothetical protein N0V90_008701 [Kalmusia sp. IMI 367209]
MQSSREKPRFKVVGCLSLDKCIPKSDLKYLNQFGQFQKVDMGVKQSINTFDIEHGKGYERRMTVAFKIPFIAEILGSGYEKMQNETFEMLRHPRVKKIHHDRTWEDAVTMDDLKRMAAEKWDVPDVEGLNSHAKDVATLVRKYLREKGESQVSISESEATQESTQRTSQPSTVESTHSALDGAVVQETQQTHSTTCTTISSSQCSGSTQENGHRASKEMRSILVREDTSERLENQGDLASYPTPSTSSGASTVQKRSFAGDVVSPPLSKRRKTNRTPLKDVRGNRDLGSFNFIPREKGGQMYTGGNLSV